MDDNTGDQQNSNTTQNPLEKFAESLMEEKNYPELMPEVRQQIKEDLMLRIDDFLAARIIAELSDEDVEAFEKLLNAGAQPADIQQFAVDHIQDFEDFLTQSLMEFRAVYLGLLDAPASQAPNEDADMPTTGVAAASSKSEDTPPPAPVN